MTWPVHSRATCHAVTPISGFDVRGLTGVQFFVAYETSLTEMVNNARFKMVYQVPCSATVPEQTRRQEQNALDQRQGGADPNAQQGQRDRQQPDHRPHQQRQQGQGPAQYEQNQPPHQQEKSLHASATSQERGATTVTRSWVNWTGADSTFCKAA